MSEVISVVLLVLVLVELHSFFSSLCSPPPPAATTPTLTGSGKCSKRQCIQWSALSARNTRTAPKKRRAATIKTNEKNEREREVKEVKDEKEKRIGAFVCQFVGIVPSHLHGESSLY